MTRRSLSVPPGNPLLQPNGAAIVTLGRPRKAAAVTGTLEMVLYRGEWRAVGVVSPEELEELERDHAAGDIRAEARLRLLREGRPGDRR